MTGYVLRIILFAIIGAMIYFGVRRIYRDWKGQFKEVDKQRHKRDLQERQRPDVVTLKRDKDGKFRPPEDVDD
ncbi:hypothetical protein [Devosia sp.]|uniref:hypothetical protein n=1 Tax=Devosia sp. TaxID=1871048 RepID=UPI003A8FF9AB